MFTFYTIFLILVISKLGAGFEYFLSNFSSQVEKENFIYYSMTYGGTILLELTSVSGDCDLYVSQNTAKPSFEPESNCLSSNTCGVDSLIIPKRYLLPEKLKWRFTSLKPAKYFVDRSFKRPVGIGIFGHPSHDICTYNLIFYRVDDSRDIFNFDPYADTIQKEVNSRIYKETSEEEESLFFYVLRTLVVFLIEIIL